MKKHYADDIITGDIYVDFEYPDSVEGACYKVIPGEQYSLFYTGYFGRDDVGDWIRSPYKIKWYKADGTFISDDWSTIRGVPAPPESAWAGFVREEPPQ